MRTPLNSISGLISLLQEGTQDRSPEYLSALRATSNHLNSIINDILDLSKVEAGKLVFDSKPFDLRESLQNIVTGFSLLVQEKGLQLKLAADDNVPALLVGDSIRLSQIIYNLLGNALKFTEKGYVSLAVTNLSQSPEVCELGFELIDTGKGMSQEGITQILEPYGQAEGQSYQQFGGTGLGMGIARELIQLMGGELTITSKLGSGTKIAFAIKLIADKDTPISTKVTELNLSHLKVLVAEDDLVTQMVLKDTLAQFHITNVHFVSNKDALREQLQETAFDVILSDLNLADGSAADVFIDCKDKVTSPIIFLSGDSKEKVSELNALDNWQFLLKPVDAMELGKRLSEVDKIPKIDLSNLHGAAHQNTDLVKELVVIILETLPQELDRIEEAVRQQDSKLIQKILHKIGPSISYLGIPALIDARSMLYDELASGTNKDADLDVFSMQVRRALAILAKMEL